MIDLRNKSNQFYAESECLSHKKLVTLRIHGIQY